MAEGILLVNKPKGKTSFSLIAALRKILGIQKIGHAGTLDPMATGVMVILIGKRYTSLSGQLIANDKEYLAEITLGCTTDSYDADGRILATSEAIPTFAQMTSALEAFQGRIEQIPPMFSAKKVGGRKLYSYARQGQEIERPKTTIHLTTQLLKYEYPRLQLHIACSKGTYVRSIAHTLGQMLTCGGHLSGLVRTRSGTFPLESCISGELLFQAPLDEARQLVQTHLLQ